MTKYLSKTEVARMLGRSPHTIDRWIREGLFPAGTRKLGRQYWTADEVRSFMAKR